ncbi:MAG: acetyl-CoA carboxylase, biotin carboxyl carrier protein [Firmicutes bacterium]|nr:acetyl-CoA carboxylase, biotin carboxyl carrier protein [Bacillota bacterium]
MDTEKIKQILAIFDQSAVSSMDLEVGDIKIKLKKEGIPVSVKENLSTVDPSSKKKEEKSIKSPLVGTFYESVKPGASPFVQVGQRIKKGDVICIVEAMKAMNEIKSNVDGVVQEILVRDGDMVEYEQPMFVIGD